MQYSIVFNLITTTTIQLKVDGNTISIMARRTRSSSAQGKKKKVEKEEEIVEEAEEEVEVEEEVEEDENNDDEADSDDDEEDEEEEEEDVAAALFNSANAQDDEDEESDDEGDEKDTTMVAMDTLTPQQVEPYTFDLRNMLAISTDQLLIGSLYDTKNTKKNKTANNNKSEEEIPLDPKYNRGNLSVQIDEEYLLSKATVGCTQLVRALWQLPTEQSDAGPLITLPTYDEIKLPRAMVSTIKMTCHLTLETNASFLFHIYEHYYHCAFTHYLSMSSLINAMRIIMVQLSFYFYLLASTATETGN